MRQLKQEAGCPLLVNGQISIYLVSKGFTIFHKSQLEVDYVNFTVLRDSGRQVYSQQN